MSYVTRLIGRLWQGQSQVSVPFEPASTRGHRGRNWLPTESGPNALLTGGLTTVRGRCRDMLKSNPTAQSIRNLHVSNVIGHGLMPRLPPVPSLRQAWRKWAEQPGRDPRLTFGALQAQAYAARFEGGDAFLRFSASPERGLSVDVLEADQLPIHVSAPVAEGHRVIGGVEFDALGQTVAYHFHRSHPQDQDAGWGWDTLRVPADRVSHICDVARNRPGTIRGEPALMPVITSLRELDDWRKAELIRLRVSALVAGFIKTPLDIFDVLPGDPQKTSEMMAEWADRIMDDPAVHLDAGTIQKLEPGEEMEWSSPPGTATTLKDFMKLNLQTIAQAEGVIYEHASGDYSNAAERAMRHAYLDMRRQVMAILAFVVVPQICQPTWRAWLRMAYADGLFTEADLRAGGTSFQDIQTIDWIPQAYASSRPLDDVRADQEEMAAALKTPTEALLERGKDPDEHYRQLAEDRDRERAFGIVTTTNPAQTNKAGSAQGGTKENADATAPD